MLQPCRVETRADATVPDPVRSKRRTHDVLLLFAGLRRRMVNGGGTRGYGSVATTYVPTTRPSTTRKNRKENRRGRVETDTWDVFDARLSSERFFLCFRRARAQTTYRINNSLSLSRTRVYTCAARRTDASCRATGINRATVFFFLFFYSDAAPCAETASRISFFDTAVGFWIWRFLRVRSSRYRDDRFFTRPTPFSNRDRWRVLLRPPVSSAFFSRIGSNDTVMSVARSEKRLMFAVAVLLGTLLGEYVTRLVLCCSIRVSYGLFRFLLDACRFFTRLQFLCYRLH